VFEVNRVLGAGLLEDVKRMILDLPEGHGD
jgi:hypothetical protein